MTPNKYHTAMSKLAIITADENNLLLIYQGSPNLINFINNYVMYFTVTTIVIHDNANLSLNLLSADNHES